MYAEFYKINLFFSLTTIFEMLYSIRPVLMRQGFVGSFQANFSRRF